MPRYLTTFIESDMILSIFVNGGAEGSRTPVQITSNKDIYSLVFNYNSLFN